ncbi:MAG TPA: hypothetical protein VN748_10875 [Pseudonocardiaceae bacterium]|nr:hypothetical protein [Pseudonocardiaceae bacterium]
MSAARADLLVERLRLVGGKDAAVRTLSKGNAQKIATTSRSFGTGAVPVTAPVYV